MVTMRSPCCGYSLATCVELKGEHFGVSSHKIESVSLRKCPYDHWLTNKAYLSAITVGLTRIFRSFTYKMAVKTGWHRYGTKLRHCHRMYSGAHTCYTEGYLASRRASTEGGYFPRHRSRWDSTSAGSRASPSNNRTDSLA